MPAKGGNPTLSDYEVARAVVYMANKSGASLPEPAAPAEGNAKRKKPLLRPLLLRPRRAGSCRCRPGRRGSRSRAAPPLLRRAASRPPSSPAGEKLYKSVCFACHATGVANALKFGDKAAWEPHQDRHGRDGEDRHAGQAAHAARAARPRHRRRYPARPCNTWWTRPSDPLIRPSARQKPLEYQGANE